MLKFHFKVLQEDDVPIHMLNIYTRSCGVFIFFLGFNWDVTLLPFPIKGWERLDGGGV